MIGFNTPKIIATKLSAIIAMLDTQAQGSGDVWKNGFRVVVEHLRDAESMDQLSLSATQLLDMSRRGWVALKRLQRPAVEEPSQMDAFFTHLEDNLETLNDPSIWAAMMVELSGMFDQANQQDYVMAAKMAWAMSKTGDENVVDANRTTYGFFESILWYVVESKSGTLSIPEAEQYFLKKGTPNKKTLPILAECWTSRILGLYCCSYLDLGKLGELAQDMRFLLHVFLTMMQSESVEPRVVQQLDRLVPIVERSVPRNVSEVGPKKEGLSQIETTWQALRKRLSPSS